MPLLVLPEMASRAAFGLLEPTEDRLPPLPAGDRKIGEIAPVVALTTRRNSSVPPLRKEVAFIRRVGLVFGVSVVMAAMLALTVGSALAKNTQPKADYINKVVATQYNAAPGSSMFRGSATDIEGDGDPGLTAEVDARITYSGAPGPGVETTLTGGTWILCSKFTAPPRDPITRALIEPECTPNSAISLQGTVVSGGTAEWDTNGGYAVVPTLGGPILVYAGQAKVEADFINVSGTVDGVSVSGGTGKFEGTLFHQPLRDGKNPILDGTLELTF